MGKIAKFLGSAMLGGSLLFNSLGNAQSNPLNKTVRYIDPITQAGIPNKPVIYTDTQTGYKDTVSTDSQGYRTIITDVEENEALSNKYNVQVYGDANHVNFKTNIDDITIKMYDLLGKEVRTLKDKSWNLENDHGVRISAGVYPFMIYDKDKIVSRGMLLNDGKNIAHRIKNLEKENDKRQSSLEKLTAGRYTLEFFDNNEFYRIIDDVDNVNNFQDIYEAIPRLETPDLQESFLNYFKKAIGTKVSSVTGDTISVNWLQQDMHPQQVYLDTANAPSPLFISTIREVMNELEARTGIDLFEETNVPNAEGNIDFDYSTALNATTFIFRNAPPGSGLSRGAPYNATVYLDRTATTAQRIKEAVTHELNGHTLVGEVEENFPITSYPIPEKEINKLKVSRALSDYTNFSRIQN